MFSQQLAKFKNETKIKTSLRARGPPGVSGDLRSVRILRIGRIGSEYPQPEMGTWLGLESTRVCIFIDFRLDSDSTWNDSRLDSTPGKGLVNILKATWVFYP